MPNKFLHVGFDTVRPKKKADLEKLFDTALDWIRYAPNNYILWTNSDIPTWNKYIRANMNKEDGVFICELNIENRGGWLSNDIWDWLQKKR